MSDETIDEIMESTTPTDEPMPGDDPDAKLVVPEKRSSVEVTHRGVAPSNFEELWRVADAVAASGMAPQSLKNDPKRIFVAIASGMEVGLPPMQAMRSVAVINGTATLYGDGLLSVCLATGQMSRFEETIEDGPGNDGEWGRTATARCVVCRRFPTGSEITVEKTFSVAEAMKAGLWGNRGPWTQYPARMLAFRARNYALRDAFADALMGFQQAEAVSEMVPEGGKHTEIVGDGEEF